MELEPLSGYDRETLRRDGENSQSDKENLRRGYILRETSGVEGDGGKRSRASSIVSVANMVRCSQMVNPRGWVYTLPSFKTKDRVQSEVVV